MIPLLSTAFFSERNCTRLLNRSRVEKKEVIALRIAPVDLESLGPQASAAEQITRRTIPADRDALYTSTPPQIAELADELLAVGVLSFRNVRKASRKYKHPFGGGSKTESGGDTPRESRLGSSGPKSTGSTLPDVPVLIENTPSGQRRRRMSIETNGELGVGVWVSGDSVWVVGWGMRAVGGDGCIRGTFVRGASCCLLWKDCSETPNLSRYCVLRSPRIARCGSPSACPLTLAVGDRRWVASGGADEQRGRERHAPRAGPRSRGRGVLPARSLRCGG